MLRTVPLNISPSDYEYGPDTQARSRLSRLHELREFSREFICRVAEPWISGELAGNGLRVTQTQLPWLHSVVVEVAALLDVPVPHVFVRQDPFLNAFTHGVGNQAFLAITHALLEQLEGLELRFIIGHEIGHIKSQHVLYTSMASYLFDQAARARNRVPSSLLAELTEWQRQSEVTADRAGLLICGDVDAACTALLTTAIGSRKLSTQVDVGEFVENQELSIEFNPIARRRELSQSHPFMPKRIRELLAFASSEHYRSLLSNGITLGESREHIGDSAQSQRM